MNGVLQRFVVLYFTLYMLPFPLTAFGGLGSLPPPLRWISQAGAFLSGLFEQGANALAVWVGEHVLRLGAGAVVIQPTGSGDTMLAYVQMFCLAVLAAAAAVAWSLARPAQAVSPRAMDLFRTYMRYAMAGWLLIYGFSKVPPMQFQPPGPELLSRTYGESSPMGLLWTFMGFSPAYTMFAGLAELVPGFLLLSRRTATLGALLGSATMLNVVALNFMYDVPVKLFSAHLWLALVIIAAPDVPRLLNLLVLNRDAPAAVLYPYPPAHPRLMTLAKAVFIILLVSGHLAGAYTGWYQFGPGQPSPPLAGIYDVEAFEVNGEERPPLWTDEARWRRLMVSRRANFVTLQKMADKSERLLLKHDEKAGTFVLTPPGSKESFTLTCTMREDGWMTLEGPFRDGNVRVALKRVREGRFPIQSRGFNWIQELPYNR
jgi:hypothetical protein